MPRLGFGMLAAALLCLLSLFPVPASAQAGGELSHLERYVSMYPTDLRARRGLAEAYAQSGLIEEAVTQYLAVLKRSRGDDQAKARVNELVRAAMPQWLPPEAAEVAPFRLRTLDVKLAGPVGARTNTRRMLLTTEAFPAPEEQRRDRVHGWAFPLTDYGYVWEPASARWVMKVRAHRGPQASARLAEQALAAALCLYWVAREYLYCDPTRPQGGPIDLWLASEGQPGARANGRSLYLYSVGTERTPAEWLREVAHEYGHLSLPGIGGFTQTNDPWADGDLGELLFIKWLAANGDGSSALLPWSAKEAEAEARARRDLLIAQARGRPDAARLRSADAKARDYFLGLALRVEQSAGPRFLGEALLRCPKAAAPAFLSAVEALAKERAIKVW
jgi:hypothetical protein